MVPHAVTALVPLKALGAAKTRLAPALTPADRRDLAAAMAAAVCDACLACPTIGSVVLLAGDDAAARVASDRDVVVRRPPEPGLAAALADADAAYAAAEATLVVAADLPAVRAPELTALIAVAGAGPVVAVAPTADGGTGALLRRPPQAIPPAFGPASASAHGAAAAAAGIRLVRWWSPALGHDIDEPDDLRRAPAQALAPGRLLPADDRGGRRIMLQGTVKHFDTATSTGTVLLDDETEVVVDAETFATSGLQELRIGQRVRLDLAEGADADHAARAARVRLISI